MNSIKTLYKLMEVSSRDLEIPDAYQRKLNTERVAKIVAGFNERIANEPKVSFRDGHYYVFDGQHTIVARKHMNGNNDLPILCKVYYGMTEADEALLFAMQTGYSAALTPSAKLRANLRGEVQRIPWSTARSTSGRSIWSAGTSFLTRSPSVPR